MDVPYWMNHFRAHAESLATDAAHDLEHLQRVVNTALELARREGAALEIVIPAAWLHDCVVVPKDSPERARASALAAEEAVRYLGQIGYPSEHVEAIAHCIEAHSYSAGIPPRTLEAQVVQDADRLDALGAIGIARCLALGGSMGRTLYSDHDPFCQSRIPDDGTYTLDHFFRKLLKLPMTMQTSAGREEANRRAEFMQTYLAQLSREILGNVLDT